MFFSTNNTKNVDDDPFCYFPENNPDHPFHLPISFFPFPSPFDLDDDHHQFEDFDFMFHQKPQNSTPSNTNMELLNSDQIKTKKKKTPIRSKRLSKKDRHSKITTAKGLRDRRMRLSLPVARQFFGLQDMLGVDKPSKTVEWLLVQAKPQILKLANISSPNFDFSSNSNNSESAIVDEADDFGEKIESLKSDGKRKKRVVKQQQPIRKAMAKEMREMARARARARTMEKKSQDFDQQNFNKISSCGEELSGATTTTTHHSYNDLNPAVVEVQKPIFASHESQPIIDFQLHNFSSNFEIMAKWSPSYYSTFNYLHHQTENLDLQEENEFEDSGIFG